jgi:hypothetical protein
MERYRELRAQAQVHIAERLKAKPEGKDYGPDGHVWGTHSMEAATEGEIAICMFFGGKPNFRLLLYGDGGSDIFPLFRMADGRERFIKVNVKGVWKRPNVLPVGSRGDYVYDPNTIYAQAYRHPGQGPDNNDIELGPWPLNGWMWGYHVMQYPVRNWGGRWNHEVPSREPNLLLPMDELMMNYCGRWFQGEGGVQQAVYY